MVDSVVLDERLALGFAADTRFSTSIVEVAGGFVRANQNWAHPRQEYSFSTNNMLIADTQAMVAFFKGRRGRARSWLLKDWTDYQLTDENIGTGDGSTVDFQMVKSYDSNNPYVRPIRHRKSGTPVTKIDGVIETGRTIGAATGIITFDVAPGLGLAITVTAEFYVPVRFGEDVISAQATGPEGIYGIIEGLTAIEERV